MTLALSVSVASPSLSLPDLFACCSHRRKAGWPSNSMEKLGNRSMPYRKLWALIGQAGKLEDLNSANPTKRAAYGCS